MSKITAALRYFFTPHHTNNHRPRILHPEILIVLIAILSVLYMGIRVAAKTYPDILGYATNITVEDLLLYTNQERLDRGFPALKLNPALSKAAEQKALDMFEDDYWAHISPDGATPWDFIIAEGYSYSFAGENLARDFSDSRGVVTAWVNSQSHRENLLRDKYEEIGFGVVNGVLDGNETTLVVQMFGTSQNRVPKVTTTSAVGVGQEPVKSITTKKVYNLPATIKKPVIDQSSMQRSIVLFVLGGLALVLFIDTYLIWRRKTVRIAGHNFAHVIFIVSLIGILLVSTRGSIL